LSLLSTHEFAPITFQVGFLEAPLSTVAEAYGSWHRRLAEKFRAEFSIRATTGGLDDCLPELEPLTTPQDRDLIVETDSAWVAFFTKGSRVPDVWAPVGELCRLLACRGIAARCIPDRDSNGSGQPRIYGCVSFDLFSPRQTDWLNVERSVCSMNDGGKWEFWARGTPQEYEELDQYTLRRIADRFRADMLTRYCAALGLRASEPNFYGGHAVIGVHPVPGLVAERPRERLTMREARERLGL
jgi:hypothetical protein